MKTRCPACGAVASLDALIAHEEAAAALRLILDLDRTLARQALRYLGLFRPAQGQLSMARVSRLLAEIVPDMQAQRILRDGKVYQAPLEAWAYAFEAAVSARDNGTLKTPLKSHGYLYEIIACYQPKHLVAAPTAQPSQPKASSQMTSGLAALEALKGARHE